MYSPVFIIEITYDPLDFSRALAFLQHPDCGGIDVFIGTTRRTTGEKITERLLYEGYEPMAVAEFQRLLETATARWGLKRAVAMHRLGEVPPAEASILIGVSTPHRAAAFEACRWLVDEAKQQVPIWKREIFNDGQEEWVEGQIPKILK